MLAHRLQCSTTIESTPHGSVGDMLQDTHQHFGLLATDYAIIGCQWPAGSPSWAIGQTYLLAHQLHGVYPRQHHSSGPQWL